MDRESLTRIVDDLLARLRDPEYHLPTITRDLDECRIEYAIIGGLALRFHNVLRETERIELLISKKSYPRIAEYLIGVHPTFLQNLTVLYYTSNPMSDKPCILDV